MSEDFWSCKGAEHELKSLFSRRLLDNITDAELMARMREIKQRYLAVPAEQAPAERAPVPAELAPVPAEQMSFKEWDDLLHLCLRETQRHVKRVIHDRASDLIEVLLPVE